MFISLLFTRLIDKQKQRAVQDNVKSTKQLALISRQQWYLGFSRVPFLFLLPSSEIEIETGNERFTSLGWWSRAGIDNQRTWIWKFTRKPWSKERQITDVILMANVWLHRGFGKCSSDGDRVLHKLLHGVTGWGGLQAGLYNRYLKSGYLTSLHTRWSKRDMQTRLA